MFGSLSVLITTFLLAVVLITGPLILGAARLWVALPLLCVVALLLLVQGMRLTAKPPAGALRRIDAIDLSVVLFVLYAIVRWLTSPAAYFSRIEAMEVVAYAVVFLTCRYGMAHRKCCMTILYLLVGLGVGETIFGYYLSNHLDWFPFGESERQHLLYAPRWLGTYDNPNTYAGLLVMALGAALALGSFSKLPWPARIVLFYLAIMMIVGVICSGSRGAWIALLAAIGGLTVMGIRHGTRRWWFPVAGALVLIVFTGALFSQSQIARNRLHGARLEPFGGAWKSDPRLQLTEDALRIAHDHPFFGTGPGTFVFIHPHYQDSTFTFNAELTHDDYLNCLDDYGLVGFGLAMFFVAAITLKFFSSLDVDNRWQDRVLVGTGFAAWVALVVHSLFDFNLHVPANALIFFSLTGLALGRFKKETERRWSTLSLAPLGPWLGAGVIVLGLIYGVEVARTALSNHIYQAVFAYENEVPVRESIRDAEDALDVDAGNAQDLVLIGDLHRYEASLQKSDPDQMSEAQQAVDAYQKALLANSLDDSMQARMGMALDLMQKYPEALAHFLAAVTAQPYNGQFWYWLGHHYQDCGMTDQAAHAYAVAEQCPHGIGENAASEKQLRVSPKDAERNAPLPLLAPPPQTNTPAATP